MAWSAIVLGNESLLETYNSEVFVFVYSFDISINDSELSVLNCIRLLQITFFVFIYIDV